jgi:hypothetical protein
MSTVCPKSPLGSGLLSHGGSRRFGDSDVRETTVNCKTKLLGWYRETPFFDPPTPMDYTTPATSRETRL